MKTITKFSVFILTFAWIGFGIATIHFMRIQEASASSLWLGIPLAIGLGSSVFSMLWMQNPDVWKSIDELRNERNFYKRNNYYDKTFIKALKKEVLESAIPLKNVEKRANDLEIEEFGENGYQD